ncbi:MAG TPA: hypothetical protein VD833_14315 [Vicinamibacterales bacterium]|nr:hypothetical protein [Vicinamibacterales bacterium]
MNRSVGWASMAVGVATGLVMGLWSFDGPLPVPTWLGDYGDTPRQLARLGHIAFLGLGILNLLLAHELPRSSLGHRGRTVAAVSMNVGNVLLPIGLFAAAAWAPAKYLLGIPATSVFLALCLAAWGARPVRVNRGRAAMDDADGTTATMRARHDPQSLHSL